jgi:cation diffusion facilitator family transporter
MRTGKPFEFPESKHRARRRARRLAWLSIGLLLSAATLLFVTLGQSEAMKTAWVSDLLSIIPPAALLVSMRYELRPPTRRFPYGYSRAISVCFLVTAGVLTVIGCWLFADGAMKLVGRHRPPIGTLELAGRQFWLGWAMIGALGYSLAVGMLIGHLKKPVAEELVAKEIEAEAQMNRAEWISEGAAIAGLLLVAFGFWWGDAAAAGLISLSIIRDGWQSLRQVVGDLMDEAPTVLGRRKLDDLPARLRGRAEELAWVERAAVRLREHGHALTGEVFVVPRDGTDLVAQVERAADELTALDWRLHDLVVVPVGRLDGESPPRV